MHLPIKCGCDPIQTIIAMGCENIWDYRYRDNNLVLNAADPDLNLGADVALNGGFELPYHSLGTVAEHWNFVGTGTPSRETTLPWTSGGTSAQRVDNDTRYGNTVFTQPVISFMALKQTYRFNFKIKVLSGNAQIRIATWTPWQVVFTKDVAVADGAVEGTLYFSAKAGATAALQVRNTGTSTPLTCILDDFEIIPVQNDKHMILYPYGYDEGAWEEDGYNFAGLSIDAGFNYNRTGQLNPGSEVTSFTLLTPAASMYTIQGFWNSPDNERAFWDRRYGAKAEGLVSTDGIGYAKYEGAGADPYASGQRRLWVNRYDGPNSTEDISINGVDYPTSYTLGTPKNPLLQGVPYTHGCIVNAGAFSAVTPGLFEVAGFFTKVLSNGEKELLENLLSNLR